MFIFKRRLLAVRTFLIVILLLIVCRLGFVCVKWNDEMSRLAVSQRVVDVGIEEKRGQIYDRNMELLTYGDEEHVLVAFPSLVAGEGDVIEGIEMALGLEHGYFASLKGAGYVNVLDGETDAHDQLSYAQAANVTTSVRKGGGLCFDVDEEMVEFVEESMDEVDGMFLISVPKRYSGLAAHITGYISGTGDGISGVEHAWNDLLSRSSYDVATLYSDSTGNAMYGMGIRTRRAGQQESWVKLSLDLELQKVVEEVLDTRNVTGAVVVMDVATGEILAMASRPDFDPNDYVSQLNATNAPFINRALEPRYPGSVFKTVVAAAALESNVADENTSYVDTGYIEKGGHTFKCPSYVNGGHGKVTLKDAFALSCNTAFIDLGCKTGAKAIVDCAKRLGVGKVWDLGIGNTKRVALPTPPLGDASVANFSLGQAVVTMSPLDVAVMVSAVANGGILNAPKLVLQTCDYDGNVCDYVYPKSERAIEEEVASRVRRMMEQVAETGTASSVLKGTNSAGKTGTAQTGRIDGSGSAELDAWFAGYFPASAPKFAIVVMVEAGRSGSASSAPIFREVVNFLDNR